MFFRVWGGYRRRKVSGEVVGELVVVNFINKVPFKT
jgi:hypothetical protein